VRAAWALLVLSGIAYAKDPPPPSTDHVPRFSHNAHKKLEGYPRDCADCHKLDAKSGEPIPPGADGHKPCSDARCHGPRLSANLTTHTSLCKGCHEQAEKFQASAPRLVHREDKQREFGYRINHRRHLSVPGLEHCDTCHKLTKSVSGDEVTVAVHRPGHGDCQPCHAKSGSKPSLTQCDSCHDPGEAPRPRQSSGGVWRVYDKFTHDTHRLDVRTAKAKPGGVGRGWSRYDRATAQTLGCGTCHATAAKSEAIKDMDLLGPCAMGKTCMGQCHNGKWAFQGSGTSMKDCLLCHSGVNENTPAPASHCGG
jgi:hypothetical protein